MNSTTTDKKKSSSTSSRVNMYSLVLIALMAGVGGSYIESTLSPYLRTKTLAIEDETGVERILITADPDTPSILFLDQDGNILLDLGVGQTGYSHISLGNADSRSRLELSSQGPYLNPELRLIDQNGLLRLLIYLDETGRPVIEEIPDDLNENP